MAALVLLQTSEACVALASLLLEDVNLLGLHLLDHCCLDIDGVFALIEISVSAVQSYAAMANFTSGVPMTVNCVDPTRRTFSSLIFSPTSMGSLLTTITSLVVILYCLPPVNGVQSEEILDLPIAIKLTDVNDCEERLLGGLLAYHLSQALARGLDCRRC